MAQSKVVVANVGIANVEPMQSTNRGDSCLAATLLLSASHLAEATTFLPVIAWVVLAGLSWYARFPAGAVATRSQVG